MTTKITRPQGKGRNAGFVLTKIVKWLFLSLKSFDNATYQLMLKQEQKNLTKKNTCSIDDTEKRTVKLKRNL